MRDLQQMAWEWSAGILHRYDCSIRLGVLQKELQAVHNHVRNDDATMSHFAYQKDSAGWPGEPCSLSVSQAAAFCVQKVLRKRLLSTLAFQCADFHISGALWLGPRHESIRSRQPQGRREKLSERGTVMRNMSLV